MASPLDFSLDGRVAFVIGGATGIGYAVSAGLIKYGATVIIGGRTADVGAQSAAELGATYVPIDVTESASVDEAVATIVGTHGHLDIAVNGAGTGLNKPTVETTDDEWSRVFETNISGTFRCCRAEGRVMLEQGSGSIINIASMSAHIVNHPQRQAAYNSSKAAIVHYTRSLAGEWGADNIRVNSISPGYTETALTAVSRAMPDRLNSWLDKTPLHRIGTPDEMAGAVVYLASDASSFVTGADIVMDGGYSIW
ncbi:MAG: short-chain dehydrogenase/reductase [Microbacteriaceae bacterium]|nr:short-chain dehydrogenase/reductase [Microbacteriaceae bacterium]